MSFIDRLASRILTKSIITHKSVLSDHVFHIRLQSESFRNAAYVPGNFLRLFCGKDKAVGIKDKVRSYSVWNYDRDNASIDLAVCNHSDGPGSAWATECKVSDALYFSWHQGKFIIDDTADYYIFIGDLSTLGHLYEIRRNLPQGKLVYSFIYSNNKNDFFPDVDASTPFNFYTLAENPGEVLLAKIQSLPLDMTKKGMVYIGGDSRLCISLHSFFKNSMRWKGDQIKVKPFWNPTKKGLE